MDWNENAVALLDDWQRGDANFVPYDTRKDFRRGVIQHIFTNTDHNQYKVKEHSEQLGSDCPICNPAVAVTLFGDPHPHTIYSGAQKARPEFVPFNDDLAVMGIIYPEFVLEDIPVAFDPNVGPVARYREKEWLLRWKVAPNWWNEYDKIMGNEIQKSTRGLRGMS